jgi:hypothetical protein
MTSAGAIFLLIAGLLSLLGGWLVKTGFFPRLRGEIPHCARCGYNLTLLTSDRCPECGSQLTPDGVRIGEGQQSVLRILWGFVCFMPLLLFVVAWFGED